MKSSRGTQYTLRQIPRAVDERLQRKTRGGGKNLNQTAGDVLTAGQALSGEDVLHHDLDFMVGIWIEDSAFEDSFQVQDQVEPHLWR